MCEVYIWRSVIGFLLGKIIMLEFCRVRKENEWVLGINVIFNGWFGGFSNGRWGDEFKY